MPFPVSHDRVLAVEAKLGRCLPAQYSARVVRDNGGEIRALGDNWRLHPVWDPSTKKTIKRTAFDLIKELRVQHDAMAFHLMLSLWHRMIMGITLSQDRLTTRLSSGITKQENVSPLKLSGSFRSGRLFYFTDPSQFPPGQILPMRRACRAAACRRRFPAHTPSRLHTATPRGHHS